MGGGGSDCATGQKVHVLYATVTGNAEEIARRIHAELLDHKLPQGLCCAVQDYEKTSLGSQEGTNNVYVIVASTTGDGDPPDTARPFMRLLRKKNPTLLSQVSYTVLGLGDTNYENFCRTGKRIDAAMKKLGATSFYKRGDADDGIGLEMVVEPWIAGLWNALKSTMKIESNIEDCELDGDLNEQALNESNAAKAKMSVKSIGEAVRSITAEELGFPESALPGMLSATTKMEVLNDYGMDAPISVSAFYDEVKVRQAHVTNAKKLTAESGEKTVWHIEVSSDRSVGHNNSYRAGDAFGMLVENKPQEVDRLLQFLPGDGKNIVRLSDLNGNIIATASVEQFLRQRVDIRAIPKKTFLRALSQFCLERAEAKKLLELSSRDGRKMYNDEVLSKSLSTIDVLESFAPSCRPPLAILLDQMPPLALRWYSATSSPQLDGDHSLHFAFSVVRNGLATEELSEKCEAFLRNERPAPVLLLPRESDASGHFHPPELESSYIMVGPGTGVAPFRGFLRERASLLRNKSKEDAGECLLFFGCRQEKVDFLYKDELRSFRDDGTLSLLDVAFSRDGPQKVYVQDRIRAQGLRVAQLLMNGGYVFVCGDGGGMARGVDLALVDVLAENMFSGNMDEAKAELKKLAKEHRYVRDIWYFGSVET